MMRAVFCGHDFFVGCLEAMLEEGLEVVRVFSARPRGSRRSCAAVQRLAGRTRIKVEFGPLTLAHLDALAEAGVRLIVVAAYPHRVPVQGSPVPFAVNVHPSLLPEGRGAWPLPAVILERRDETGVTIHKLAAKLDAGDVLAQERIAVDDRETLESLTCKVQIAAKTLVRRTLRDVERCWAHALPQGQGAYNGAPGWEERTIRWDRNVAAIDRLTRAFGKAGTLGRWNGRTWLVENVSVWQTDHGHPPGAAVHRTEREVVVAAADGFVCIRFFRSRLRQRLDLLPRLAASYLRSARALGTDLHRRRP